MLHDFLFALSGCGGDIFLDRGTHFEVSSDFHVVSSCEKSILNELLKVGFLYQKLNNFVTRSIFTDAALNFGGSLEILPTFETLSMKCRGLEFDLSKNYKEKENQQTGGKNSSASLSNSGLSKNHQEKRGIYFGAFCEGVDCVLQKYRQFLVEIEAMFLQDAEVPFTIFQSLLAEYKIIFPSLYQVCEQLERKKYVGCQILSVLYDSFLFCGVPSIQTTFEEIFTICLRVFYRQLKVWLIYGIVEDFYAEFFIQDSFRKPNFEEDVDELIGEKLMDERRERKQRKPKRDEKVDARAENQGDGKERKRFVIRNEMIPCFLPFHVIETIFSIGKSVFDLSNFQGDKKDAHFNEWDEEEMVSGILDEISAQAFHLTKFELTMNRFKTNVSQRLWRVVIEQNDFWSCVLIVKDFFLLGKGDFYLMFIEATRHIFKSAPTSSTEHEMNVIFKKISQSFLTCAPSSCTTFERNLVASGGFRGGCLPPGVAAVEDWMEEESMMQKFEMIYFCVSLCNPPDDDQNDDDDEDENHDENNDEARKKNAGKVDWKNRVSIEFQVKWPLDLLFDSFLISKYNKIFSFVFHLRRVQIQLSNLWFLQKIAGSRSQFRSFSSSVDCSMHHADDKFCNLRYFCGPDFHKLVWNLRYRMSFLIENFQYYLQVDVLEAQFRRLYETIHQEAQDFETVRLANVECCSVIYSQCFLHQKHILQCLYEIFNVCQHFSYLMEDIFPPAAHSSPADHHSKLDLCLASSFPHRNLQQVVFGFHQSFQEKSKLLFHLFSNTKSHHSSPFVSQFLLRLDFNRFYTTQSNSAS